MDFNISNNELNSSSDNNLHSVKPDFPRVVLEKDIRALALKTLADQCLDVSDLNLETRTYMFQNILPTLVLALEKLLREVDRMGLIEEKNLNDRPLTCDSEVFEKENGVGSRPSSKPASENLNQLDGKMTPSKDGPESNGSTDVANVNGEAEESIAPAAEDSQMNNPQNSTFDPINWLAQHLYRNNPRYISIADGSSKSYMEAMTQVCIQLKSRLVELESNQRELKRAQQLAAQKEEERKKNILAAQIAEKKRMFTELLLTCFRKWTKGLIQRSPYILHSDLTDSLKKLQLMDSILANETIAMNTTQLFVTLAMETSSKHAPTLLRIPRYDIDLLNNEFTSSEDYTFPTEDLFIWDQQGFLSMMLSLTENWTIDDVTVFLQSLISTSEEYSMNSKKEFESVIYFPSIQDFNDLGVSGTAWIQFLDKILMHFSNSLVRLTDEDCEEFLKLWIGFKESPIAEKPMNASNWDEIQLQFNSFSKSIAEKVGIKGLARVLHHFKSSVQKEKEEILNNKAASKSKTRKEAIGALFDSISHGEGEKHILVRKINGYIDVLLGSMTDIVPGSLLDTLSLIKIPVMARTLMTKKINKEEFTAHVYEQCAALRDDDFDQILSLLHKAMFGNQESSARIETPQETAENKERKLQSEIINREDIENRAKEKLLSLRKNYEMNISELSTQAINIVGDAFKALKPKSHVLGRISLLENGGQNSEGNHETILRYVAFSSEVQNDLLGAAVTEKNGVDYEGLQDGKPVNIVDFETHTSEKVPVDSQIKGKYLGVPFNSDGRTLGTFGLNLRAVEPNEDTSYSFDDADIAFATECVDILTKIIERFDERQKVVSLAEAASHFVQDKSQDSSVELYLIEEDYKTTERQLLRIEEVAEKAVTEQTSPYMQPLNTRFTAIQESDDNKTIWSAVETKTTTEQRSEDNTQIISYSIPVIDEQQKVVAVIRLLPKPFSGAEGKDNFQQFIEDVQKIAKIFATAIDRVKQERFAESSFSKELEADAIDENSRRNIMFPKLMLLHIRDLLGKLDSASVSEIRSYRKPPALIHKIVKAVLYVFGKKPKEVKKWSDASKFVTMDLLKDMIAYDPTAIQKKIRFSRMKRILKTIPFGDVRHKGSLPAQYMYDWLVASLDLRQRAVESRKRLAETYDAEIESEDETASQADEDGDEEDDSMSDTGSILSIQETGTKTDTEETSVEQKSTGLREKSSRQKKVQFSDDIDNADQAPSQDQGPPDAANN